MTVTGQIPTSLSPLAAIDSGGGHPQAEPLQNFQPVTAHLPPVFMQTRAAGWGSAAVDSATAHQRLAHSRATARALHDAGIPIVAGTDEGVPGYSAALGKGAGFIP